MNELIEPPPVKFSFDAPGWYVASAVLLLLIIITSILLYRHYKHNRYRAAAILLLTQKEQSLLAQQRYDMLMYESDLLMKRVAMKKYGRENVAGLTSSQWISYLNQTWREKTFTDEDGQILSNDIYAVDHNISKESAEMFVAKTKSWIRKHR